jgi:hypothetical protein
VRLASRERELLTNQSASPPVVAAIRRRLDGADGVRAVPRLDVLVIGPRTLLVTGEVVVDGDDVSVVVAGLRDLLRSEPGIAEVYLTPVPVPDPRSLDRGDG